MNIKIVLSDLSKDLTDAWARVFAEYSNVEVKRGDILNFKADAIVSPANSFGFMDGGIDLVYSEYFGWDLQKRLQKIIQKEYYGELPVGNAAIVEICNEKIKYLVSAPTMRLPADVSRTLNAYLAFRAVLIVIKEHNARNEDKIQSVLCPGLPTGVGKMPPMTCAKQMKKAYDSIIMGFPPFPETLFEAMQN